MDVELNSYTIILAQLVADGWHNGASNQYLNTKLLQSRILFWMDCFFIHLSFGMCSH